MDGETTVAEAIDHAWQRVDWWMGQADVPSRAMREMALAKTALEDARMRFTRGLAMSRGVFAPVDLEKAGELEERKSWVSKIEEQQAHRPGDSG